MRFEFFTGSFWGILFILIGIIFFVRSIFNLNIPVFKIVVGFLFIYWGLSMMFGTNTYKNDKNIIFSHGRFDTETKINSEYNIIFSDGEIDLTNLQLKEKKSVEINTIFGSAVIKVSDKTAVVFEGNTVFGATKTPDGNTNIMGDTHFASGNMSDLSPFIIIKSNAIFGSAEIIIVESEKTDTPEDSTANDEITG